MSEKNFIKKNFINYVNKIVEKNKIFHAYLIEVDNYDLDMKYVYNFIKMILLNCTYDEIIKSNNKIVKLIDKNEYPDLFVISSDTLTIKKEQIINLEKEFNNKSLFDNKRFYIVKETEKLNVSSANTILKFLEEPEDDIVAILLTNNRYRVFDTILSRCQILSLKENLYDLDVSDDVLDFLDFVLHPKKYFINPKMVVENYFSDKINGRKLLTNISVILLACINYSVLKNYNNNFKDLFNNILKDNDINNLVDILSIFEEETSKLEFNVNFKLWLDSLFCRLIGGIYD